MNASVGVPNLRVHLSHSCAPSRRRLFRTSGIVLGLDNLEKRTGPV